MPLESGSSNAAVSANIRELVSAGHPQAQAVAIAMHKARESRDAVAAGVMLTSPKDDVLFIRRSAKGDHAGEWAFPGGRVEKGESPVQAAVRELMEETGLKVDPTELVLMSALGDFDTFHALVEGVSVPVLNDEHTEYRWAQLTALPQPLHPGVLATLQTAYPDSSSLVEYESRDSRVKLIPIESYVYTSDRGYYAPTSAGKTRRLTPEGFLICEDIGLARTGKQVYAAHELPGLPAGPDGKIIVERDAEEVFHPDTIASFEGKPVTIFHPREFVTPENWKQLSVGHIQNVRRGEGAESDLLKGDIVITDAAAVHYAQANLPDISCGYDAKYKSIVPGRAKQREIRGNHGAMVPNGRAGDRCAIKDHAYQEFEHMSKSTFWGKAAEILTGKGLRAQDVAELRTALEPLEEPTVVVQPVRTRDDNGEGKEGKGELMDAIKALDARVGAVMDWQKNRDAAEEKEKEEEKQKAKDAEAAAAKLKEKETDDTIIEAEETGTVISLGKVWAGKTGDAVLADIRSSAEIIAPGYAASMPTTDGLKGNGGAALTRFMQGALDKLYTRDSAGKDLVEPFLLGRKPADLRGIPLVGAFNGVAQLVRLHNNGKTRGITSGLRTTDRSGAAAPANGVTNAATYSAHLAAKRKEMAGS